VLLTRLHPTEERHERLVDPPQHVLASREVGYPQRTGRPNLFQLVGLVGVAQADAVHTPRRAAFVQRRVVQPTGFVDLLVQRFGLGGRWIRAVLERPAHSGLLPLPLRVDGALDPGFGGMAHGRRGRTDRIPCRVGMPALLTQQRGSLRQEQQLERSDRLHPGSILWNRTSVPIISLACRSVPPASRSRAFLCQLKQAVPCPPR